MYEMPRSLKRRSDAISRDESDSDIREPPHRQTQTQTQQRRRQPTTPSASASENDNDNDSDGASEVSDSQAVDAQTHLRTLTKKLIRLALSAEYARQPLRRTDINTKIMKDASASGSRVQFRTVFNAAQETLRDVFGMELVDLPSREKTGINERRKAASQKIMATQKDTQKDTQKERESQSMKDPLATAQYWILVSCLPQAYRVHPTLLVPSRAPDEATESTYIALCTLLVSIVYLHTPSGSSEDPKDGSQQQDTTEPISEAKFTRYLSRLDLENWTPMGGPNGTSQEKLIARMLREGYLEKRTDTIGGEEIVEYIVGPRGKREIGRKAVAGLVRGVYGFGVDGKHDGLEIARQEGEDEEEDQEEAALRDEDEEAEVRRRPVKMERDELERRLKRTLGNVVALRINPADRVNGVTQEDAEMNQEGG